MEPKLTKAEQEREARIQARAASALIPPKSTDMSHLDKLPEGVAPREDAPAAAHSAATTSTKKSAKAKPAKARTAKPATKKPAVSESEPPVGAHVHRRAEDAPAPPVLKVVPPAAPQEPEKTTPWCNAHPKINAPYVVRLPQELHMKLAWLKENLPNTSIQKLLVLAAEEKVEELLAKHYKPKAVGQ